MKRMALRCAIAGASGFLADFLFGVGAAGAFSTGLAVGVLATGFASIDAKRSDQAARPPRRT